MPAFASFSVLAWKNAWTAEVPVLGRPAWTTMDFTGTDQVGVRVPSAIDWPVSEDR